ncbi:MAG: acetyl/propionyl/methylcrotonyl-CoA carboxylase subunit alpha [Rhodospirillaceae bacterium]|nr:acetyl/propionyl/methylcrotonyl-CoA carboxylase subunit alpha [Rhodospirillaceae bacterium]
MFDKILIANRGEIACRVGRTAQRLGVRTVAVYSDSDIDAQNVLQADEAVRIGPAPAAESYLVGERILQAARSTGAQAIHPGYGFLSENAAFADACEAAGIKFIGPSAKIIRTMGSKSSAKTLMEKAKVPVVPGYHGDDQNPDLLAEKAESIGYPVLIKASAGGGGKGMRLVSSAQDFGASLESAKREATSAFDDDHVLIEKFVTNPRHIEIQVFGDSHGNVVHLFERDCSIQRRHQKIVEEAPAPGMSQRLRTKMGAAAVSAARTIGYEGAGTVEFIADGLGDFYFMEMNTRLQVEHPVTEMITGQDLVEWQLRVAAGEVLPVHEKDLAICGHAVEVRLYAEDPEREFLPQTGTLRRLRLPQGEGIRCDSGIAEGDTISIHYDPMIAKLIAWHPEGRARALRRLRRALDQTEIVGLANNIALLQRVIDHRAFAEGDLDTGFIDTHADELMLKPSCPSDRTLACAVLAIELDRREKAVAQAAQSSDPWSPWNEVNSWRLNDSGRHEIRLGQGEQIFVVQVSCEATGHELDLPGHHCQCAVERDGERLRVCIDDTWLSVSAHVEDTLVAIWLDGRQTIFNRLDALVDEAGIEESNDRMVAPMSGKVIQVFLDAGTAVEAGTPILVLEAMKMEHIITAPADGTVSAVHFLAGDQVEEGARLVDFERKEG